jgi:uncharacterized repeat protein (TIGR03943 family)
MTARLSRFGIPSVLLLWGGILLYFCLSGRVVSYLHPSFQWLALTAGAMLTLLGVAVVLAPDAGEACDSDCDLHPAHGLGLAPLAVLVVPILAAALVSQDHFSATTVRNRGVVDYIGDLPAFSPAYDPALPQHDGTVGEGTMMDPSLYLQTNAEGRILAETVDLMYAASDATMREDFAGREVEVVGQILKARTDNPSDNRFHLVRMFVMCCAADARPAGIAVEVPGPLEFSEMDWVKVTGRATFPVENGRHKAVLRADGITPTPPPRESFIY